VAIDDWIAAFSKVAIFLLYIPKMHQECSMECYFCVTKTVIIYLYACNWRL